MAHFCTFFPVCESSADGGDICRGGVIFLRLILSLLVLLEFVGETLSLMLECGFSMLQDNYATPIELLRFAILCM